MTEREKFNVFPTRANLVNMRTRRVLAQKGYILLKHKRDALDLKLRELIHTLRILHNLSMTAVSDAIFSMARIAFLGGDSKVNLMQTYGKATVCLRLSFFKIIGILIPVFAICVDEISSRPYTGLSRGGEAVREARAQFRYALKILVEYASVEYSVKVMEECKKENNMRVNGLEFVVLPRYQNTIDYLVDGLEEIDRQDFYRIKCAQAKRMKQTMRDMEQTRLKRDNPEEYMKSKPTMETRKRFFLPNWTHKGNKKINVNFTNHYGFKINQHEDTESDFTEDNVEDEVDEKNSNWGIVDDFEYIVESDDTDELDNNYNSAIDRET